MWNHGDDFYRGFAWTELDVLLSGSKCTHFEKLSVTVRDAGDAEVMLPHLSAVGKLALDETDSDHG
jgi:hypothetical protein